MEGLKFSEFYGITCTAVYPRLDIKKILRSHFGNQLEKYSHHFVLCK